jgi:phage gp45-like
MTDALAIIRALIQQELRGLQLGDIAEVTSVFPHADEGDAHNYECNVKLRGSELELRKVPMATPYIGWVSTPNIGDLVLLTYLGGDANRAIIIGRLYSDEARPPIYDENEYRIEVPHKGKTSITINKDGDLILETGKTKVTLHIDDSIEIVGEKDLKLEVKGNVALKCTDCTIDASGKIDLGTGGSGVITETSHKCYFTGNALVGSKNVKSKD